MNIDDILESIDRGDLSNPHSASRDQQELTRFWVAERGAPEVLPWPAPLMDRMMERVRRQISTIEDLASSGPDLPSTSTNSRNPPSAQNLNLTLSILQTDLSRMQFLIRSLLRQRLSKLTAHALYYFSSSPSSTTADLKLSPSELTFLQSHQSLLSAHYTASFMSAFPPQLQRLDDNAGGVQMVEGPDAKKAVFVRCLAENWEGESSGGVMLRMKRGQVWVVRWEDVRGGVRGGAAEVL